MYPLTKTLRLSNRSGIKNSSPWKNISRFVVTDSGGIQEETTYLNAPCLTLRTNTERPVTITEGTNELVTHGNIEQKLTES